MKKLMKLETTRCTGRAECMKRILTNYKTMMLLWDGKQDQERKSRIIGCKVQIKTFKFFVGSSLSHKLYSIPDLTYQNPSSRKNVSYNWRKTGRIIYQKCFKKWGKTRIEWETSKKLKAFYDTTAKHVVGRNKINRATQANGMRQRIITSSKYVTCPEQKTSSSYWNIRKLLPRNFLWSSMAHLKQMYWKIALTNQHWKDSRTSKNFFWKSLSNLEYTE